MAGNAVVAVSQGLGTVRNYLRRKSDSHESAENIESDVIDDHDGADSE